MTTKSFPLWLLGLASLWSGCVAPAETVGLDHPSTAPDPTAAATSFDQIDLACEGERILFLAKPGTRTTEIAAVSKFATTRALSVKPVRSLIQRQAHEVNLQDSEAHNLLRIQVLEIDRSRYYEALKDLRADKQIIFAEGDCPVHTTFSPNDPAYVNNQLWGIKKLNPESAWDKTMGGDLTIAVVDTGVDRTHPDLAQNTWHNPGEIAGNGIDDDGNGYVDDVYGWNFYSNNANTLDDNSHGSHVAGTIAGVGDNAIGVVGLAFQAKIMAVKVMGGPDGSGLISAITQGFKYAADNGAKVINASLGGPGSPTAAACEAVNYATSRGALFVAAAGNSDADSNNYIPAGCSAAFTVAAMSQANSKCSFSNWGSAVDITAPGCSPSIYSTVLNGGYGSKAGTSMAAPHVAGVAGLVRAIAPDLTVDQVKNVIISTAVDLGTPGWDEYFGHGYPDTSAAVDLAISMSSQEPPTLTIGSNYTAFVDQLFTLTPIASDPNDDALTFTATGLPAGASLDANTGVITWTPTQEGDYAMQLKVSDGFFTPIAADLVITVVKLVEPIQPPQLIDDDGTTTFHTVIDAKLIAGCQTQTSGFYLLLLLVILILASNQDRQSNITRAVTLEDHILPY